MQDDTTNIQKLKNLVANFVEERQWNQFHSPKNLSMSIAIEASELMELFQWVEKIDMDGVALEKVREELAV